MSWLLWIVVAWFVFSVFWSITQVGKPREPYTPGATAVGVGILVGLILLVVAGGGLLG